jgi:hypothetical protein
MWTMRNRLCRGHGGRRGLRRGIEVLCLRNMCSQGCVSQQGLTSPAEERERSYKRSDLSAHADFRLACLCLPTGSGPSDLRTLASFIHSPFSLNPFSWGTKEQKQAGLLVPRHFGLHGISGTLYSFISFDWSTHLARSREKSIDASS